jgi:hypothetical protein
MEFWRHTHTRASSTGMTGTHVYTNEPYHAYGSIPVGGAAAVSGILHASTVKNAIARGQVNCVVAAAAGCACQLLVQPIPNLISRLLVVTKIGTKI